jgi:putative MATE family efflux protein
MSADDSSKRKAPIRPPIDPAGLDPSEEGGVGALRVRERRSTLSADGRLTSGRLAGLTMGGAIWALSWPIMVESFLNSLVGLTDTMMAANLGEAETTAIGAASYIMWFIGLIIMAIGVGATALVSRAIGKARTGVANAVLGQTILLSWISGILTGVFIAFAATPVAGLLSLSPEAQVAFDRYILIIACGVPAASMLFTLIACARGAGDSVGPLQAMVFRNVVNIIISWLLSGVSVWGLTSPLGLDLGVTGIALGTVAGDIAGSVMVLGMALRGRWGIRLRRRWLQPHWHTMRRLLRLGFPNFLETCGMWIGNFLVIILVGSLAIAQGGGAELLGIHIVAIRIEAFSFLPGFAMGAAAATLAGQYLGAGSATLARAAIWRCTLIAAGIMAVFGAAFLLVPGPIVAMISTQPSHLDQAPTLLRICGAVQIPFALAIVFRGAMRGAGDVNVTMWITWVMTYLVRLPAAFILCGADLMFTPSGGEPIVLIPNPGFCEFGLAGVWLGLCGELVIRAMAFSWRFLSGGWSRIEV